MIMPFGYESTQPYAGYKNDKFARHLDKLKNQIRQIKDCSLYESDKERLLKELKTEIEKALNK